MLVAFIENGVHRVLAIFEGRRGNAKEGKRAGRRPRMRRSFVDRRRVQLRAGFYFERCYVKKFPGEKRQLQDADDHYIAPAP